MTQGQKEQIDTLREQGNGYKRIAGILGVSVNTIASYCRRKTAVCPCCGAALVMTPKHRKKKFCSDACRQRTACAEECPCRRFAAFVEWMTERMEEKG